jgi:hypothetical protein
MSPPSVTRSTPNVRYFVAIVKQTLTRGKWVAIAQGRIVAVNDRKAIRHARRTQPDIALYWVGQ